MSQQRLWYLLLRVFCPVERCLQVKITPPVVSWCDPDGLFAASRALVASLAEGAALDHSQNSLKGVSAGPDLVCGIVKSFLWFV
jgi:hypothetical protein